MQKLRPAILWIVAISLSAFSAPSFLFAGQPHEELAASMIGPEILALPIVRDFGIVESVSAIAEDNTHWYLGGDFRRVNSKLATNYLELGLDGTLPNTCALPDRFNGDVYAVVATADAIYVGGDFTTYAGLPANRLAKISKTDCALDQTFSPALANGFNGVVYALAEGGDGHLFVGGSFTTYRGAPDSANRLAKVDLVTGDLNTTFSPAGATSNGFDSTVLALVYSGGNLFVGGSFQAYKGIASSALRIAKLNATSGAINTTFSPATNGFDDLVRTLVLTGGNLYVGGDFGNYRAAGANTANRLAKLDATSGVLNTTFSPAGASSNGVQGTFPYVSALATDGTSLYVGGRFNNYRTIRQARNIAKVDLSTGAIDTTFSPIAPLANGFDNDVLSLAVSGGNLYVGGSFSLYRADKVANRIAKLNAGDGTLDATFLGAGSTAQGFSGTSNVKTLFIYNNATLYTGGRFAAYGGAAVNRFAKISKTTGAIDQTVCPQDGSPSGFDNTVYQLQFSGDALVANGAFQQYRGIEVPYTVFLNPVDGTIRP